MSPHRTLATSVAVAAAFVAVAATTHTPAPAAQLAAPASPVVPYGPAVPAAAPAHRELFAVATDVGAALDAFAAGRAGVDLYLTDRGAPSAAFVTATAGLLGDVSVTVTDDGFILEADNHCAVVVPTVTDDAATSTVATLTCPAAVDPAPFA